MIIMRWPSKDMMKNGGAAELNFKDAPNYKDCVEALITHKNVHTKEDKEIERKDFKTAMEHEAYLRQQDLDMLFKIGTYSLIRSRSQVS